ncbi:MAG TPA: diguanylate cyclase [Candidatus Bathyarchaeia archaeon]|nr:diguanylate cyclase [Candidatus Bathyarchaeia archaeon]
MPNTGETLSDGTRGRRQLLYPLVYVASLTLVALSSTSLAVLGREHVIDAAIDVGMADDRAIVREFVQANLTTTDLSEGLALPDRRAAVAPLLADLLRRNGYLDVSIVSSTEGESVGAMPNGGSAVPVAPGTTEALATGQANASMASSEGPSSPSASVVEAIPIVQGQDTHLVFQIRRDATPILARAGAALRDLVLVTLSAAVVLAALLYVIFRAANSRLRKQDAQLTESRRRDPITGLLNHGAAVTALTDLVEVARADGTSIGIALIDIDNFRLLNDVHGSSAGDQALITVAGALQAEAEHWNILARFGPDEFMAIAPTAVARELPAAAKRVKSRLESNYLDLPGSERLPVTVSVGIAYFPFHAESVTAFISAATTALAEAKASGGNEISIADAWTIEPRTPHTTFDALQGLVLAIDRKDRYTKLHSEDVAVYSLFLGDRLGLPAETLKTLRIAALLHDVGKIGVPDDILRKPGRLTPYEYEIVKQHVALGDLIVRDMPDVENIREGVRYHHERWDGQGYMVGLAGENIPLIARILAVADAFSAMTTSRPYRKALPAERALEELRAVAGSQLDRELVDAFTSGMELDPNAPRPGALRSPDLLWKSTTMAA